jgi:hypothetical protein
MDSKSAINAMGVESLTEGSEAPLVLLSEKDVKSAMAKDVSDWSRSP